MKPNGIANHLGDQVRIQVYGVLTSRFECYISEGRS